MKDDVKLEPWFGSPPPAWALLKLKRVLSEVDYGISESTVEDGDFAVLKMGNIVDGEIAFTKIEGVDEVDPKLLLRTNDLLFNRTNSLDQVAKVGIFRERDSRPVTFASYLVSEKNRHSRKMQLPIVYLIYYQITLLNLSPIFF